LKLFEKPEDPYSLIISGQLIQQILEEKTEDLSAILDAKTVVMYRSSPAQKAQVVNLVRQHRPSMRTLAIGDGANDINMIQSAHVGVGLMGKEGN
jgi:magnesium-transporting ATPase (P-type)